MEVIVSIIAILIFAGYLATGSLVKKLSAPPSPATFIENKPAPICLNCRHYGYKGIGQKQCGRLEPIAQFDPVHGTKIDRRLLDASEERRFGECGMTGRYFECR